MLGAAMDWKLTLLKLGLSTKRLSLPLLQPVSSVTADSEDAKESMGAPASICRK